MHESPLRRSELLGVRYFKHRDPRVEVLHLQRQDCWENYLLNGKLDVRASHQLPADYLDDYVEISEKEARELFPAEAFVEPGKEFKPRYWRFCLPLFGWFGLFFAIFAGIPMSESIQPDSPRGMIAFGITFMVLTVVVMSLALPRKTYQHASIRITEEEVSGPTFWWAITGALWKRRGEWLQRSIPLGELDRVQSARRSWQDRVLGRQYLVSADGGSIVLSRWMYRRRDVEAILGLLGMAPRAADYRTLDQKRRRHWWSRRS